MTPEDLAFDAKHIWHPYSATGNPVAPLAVKQADGVRLILDDGTQLIDAMSSWWSVIHGYNNPALNAAAKRQIDTLPHVMFGGLTHQPAVDLCKALISIAPEGLDRVFLADSGSVAVEVAMKMAMQYWQALGKPDKQRFIALRGGYHGDTQGAMSVCDPDTGMHHLFNHALARQYFVNRPAPRFGQHCEPLHIRELEELLARNAQHIAALILEPIVQGAGGMYFYSAEYLSAARQLCTQYDVLLIADEIATGFGRSGKMFACEHAEIAPDILCLGKALTGGYVSLAATLATETIANTIARNPPKAFMHGPTFMGNPLACNIALASIKLLRESDWQAKVSQLEKTLQEKLLPLAQHKKVADARVLGAIGVLELHEAVDMRAVQQLLPGLGVWLRPFGKLVYTMPPYITSDGEIASIADAMQQIIERC
ncbi:MAG: adenosylmethionine--8-amino-7-oxononanoate transaminase [Gammaproteobacteria bacterium]|nr:adenosylmethionine--8-amino-7-oxononanoate transaminase [Gammaproteobacteria bacterium]